MAETRPTELRIALPFVRGDIVRAEHNGRWFTAEVVGIEATVRWSDEPYLVYELYVEGWKNRRHVGPEHMEMVRPRRPESAP